MDSSRRNHSFRYYIPIDSDKVHVCKKMFLNTFSLGEWSVRAWKIGNRKRLQGHMMDQDSRSESSSRRSSYDHCEDNHRILIESDDLKVT